MEKTFFISHSSKDTEYAKQLVQMLKCIGVENIVCTSINGHGIPEGNNIYDYLAEKVNEDTWVIFLLSDNYYNSAACLNEMGACWILKKRYTTILVPNFDYKDIDGAIDVNQKAFKLSDKTGLNDFKESIDKEINTSQSSNVWESQRDECRKIINQLSQIDKEQKNKLARVEFENLRELDDGKLEILIRYINDNEYSVQFNKIDIELNDDNGNEYNTTIKPREKIHHKENKIIAYSIDIGNSKYDYTSHKDHNIKTSSSRSY